ncbi:MAG TPA: MMPL family transporter [Acidimicrobiales bacterium]|nr:MMPL family transporter [Acidimicrobiales bacterium]
MRCGPSLEQGSVPKRIIVSRVREAHDNGASTPDAIISGIERTGHLVTSAVVVLVLAFVALAAGPEIP